jgi:hypothetical protein
MMLLLTGFGLLTGGMALAFLMVIQILNPSFVLSFLSYGASLIGLVWGYRQQFSMVVSGSGSEADETAAVQRS